MDEELKKVEWELKKKKALSWVNDKWTKVKNTAGKLYEEHKDEIKTYVIPAMIPVVAMGLKNHSRHKEDARDERERRCRHWDPRRGSYAYSRRPLTGKEQQRLDRLYDEGYSKTEALRMMGLLD